MTKSVCLFFVFFFMCRRGMSSFCHAFYNATLVTLPRCIKKVLCVWLRATRRLFSIAIKPRCRGGCNSFPWIAPLYLWYVPNNAECWARRHQVPFFDSSGDWTPVSRAIGELSILYNGKESDSTEKNGDEFITKESPDENSLKPKRFIVDFLS